MRRTLIGILFILHGLAHSAAGVWASSIVSSWIVTPLWLLAEAGFVAAGLGILGVTGLRRVWQKIAVAAAIASVALLMLFGTRTLLVGLVVDILLLVVGLGFIESMPATNDGAEPYGARTAPNGGHRWRIGARVVNALAYAFLAYVSAVVALRPWHTKWGTSAAELRMVLPGDQTAAETHYRVDHAVTVRAPADSVWPWLVQIGQDRAGFYSYDRLERLVGARIRNADRIHPEWQQRQAGDLIRGAQPDYLGGRLGTELGWRVTQIEPGRAIVLENWGAFVVVPKNERTSRVYVRTRGAGTPSMRAVALGPASVLMLEPAHFIMERRMLLGIRDRAEGRYTRRNAT